MAERFGLKKKCIEDIINVLKLQPEVEEAIIFGSRAMGNYKNGSDIDIALKGKKINLDTISSISLRLDELPYSYMYDVVDYKKISNPAVTAHIDELGIGIYRKESSGTGFTGLKDEQDSEWKTYKLSEIAQIIGGGTPKTTVEEYWNGDIPWLSVVDFGKSAKTVYKTEKTITEKGLRESSTKILKKGQLIISARGTVGELAMVGRDMAFNQSCYGLTASKETTNEFLYYLVKDSVGRIKQNTHGAVFDTITKQTFENIEITIPDLPTQTAIAQILSSLDDKIELNLQMNKTLEEIAQAIFKEWFVDFNFSAPQPPLGGQGASLPKGWRMGKLGEVCNLYAGGDKPEEFSEEENEKYNIPIYSNGISNEGLYGFTNHPKIVEESVTVSARGTIGYVCLRIKPYVPIVRLISAIPKKELISAKYLYLWLLNQNISGTGTTQQQLTIPDFKRFDILIPNKEIINLFTEIMDELFSKIFSNQSQIQTLTAIRDAILPKLMTGKIEVKG